MALQQAVEDRRQHPRFTLKAYGVSHNCLLRRGAAAEAVQLIDITPAGARLRSLTSSGTPPAAGEMVVVDLQLSMLTPPGLGLDSQVRWNDEREFGVQFQQELDCGVSDLQRMLDSAVLG